MPDPRAHDLRIFRLARDADEHRHMRMAYQEGWHAGRMAAFEAVTQMKAPQLPAYEPSEPSLVCSNCGRKTAATYDGACAECSEPSPMREDDI